MISPKDVHSLSEFQRNARKMLTQLRKSKRPALLTVNGKGAVVVQDAKAYQEMLEAYEHRYIVEAVRVGIEQAEAGKTRPLEECARDWKARFSTSKRRRRSA